MSGIRQIGQVCIELRLRALRNSKKAILLARTKVFVVGRETGKFDDMERSNDILEKHDIMYV